MRAQEEDWPRSRKEARKAYLKRLRKTAMSLPRAYIRKTIGSMHKGCALVKKARGGHFHEGGGISC